MCFIFSSAFSFQYLSKGEQLFIYCSFSSSNSFQTFSIWEQFKNFKLMRNADFQISFEHQNSAAKPMRISKQFAFSECTNDSSHVYFFLMPISLHFQTILTATEAWTRVRCNNPDATTERQVLASSQGTARSALWMNSSRRCEAKGSKWLRNEQVDTSSSKCLICSKNSYLWCRWIHT